MKKKISTLLIVLAGISFSGCLGRKSAGNDESLTAGVPAPIVKPEIPRVITAPEEAAEYMALHYWDNFDFADTTYIDQPEITEQAFSDYLAIVGVTSPDVARRSVASLVDRSAADEKMYYYFSELFEKYLDDPNSPMRNEEFYILVLESVLASDKVGDLDKLRPQAKLASAMKNRVGTKAADIVLTTEKGSRIRLYDIKSDYILLYFNNPDCNYCEEVTHLIMDSHDMLVPLVKQGVLNIVAVYPDEDLEAWHKHFNDMPSDWYRTYDRSLSIRGDQTYDLRAIPSLYLLDSDKTVLLKDLDKVWQIENYFAMMGY